jgi:mono/diheme cytochrome c family protein
VNVRPAVLRTLGVVAIVIILAGAIVAWSLLHVAELPPDPANSVGARELLTATIPDSVPAAEQVRRGQYLTRVGDCLSCHIVAGGQPFAGSLGLNTPFGIVYSANITPDKDTGIGTWTAEQFYRALHDGIGVRNEHLYPAFPYPWFTRTSRQDSDAIFAFLKTVPAVHSTPPPNRMAFPINIRATVAGWNLLFLDKKPFTPDPQQTAAWNRGAEIVNGLGHCSACHTPKNIFGAEKKRAAFNGSALNAYVAPDLTENQRTGLGAWTLDDIAEYLRDGRNAHANAGGPMADVVTYSTSLLSDDDRRAIATYLKAQTARTASAPSPPDAAAMKRGARIYDDVCSACHLSGGKGQPGFFPPLGHDAVVQQPDPTGIVHFVLAGSRSGPSKRRPSALTMPTFAWKLSDQEIADVTTYVRNSWGNAAAPVSSSVVQKLRARLQLPPVQQDTRNLAAH